MCPDSQWAIDAPGFATGGPEFASGGRTGRPPLEIPPYRGWTFFGRTRQATVVSTTTAAVGDEWEGIRYVFYVTAGWLAITALAVAFLMLVVPSLL